MSSANVCKMVADSGDEQSHYEDEALEALWELREQGIEAGYRTLLESLGQKDRLDAMVSKGLLEIQGERVIMSAVGETRARDIIRRHRLAERLFADVLDMKDYEAAACRIEHAISSDVEDAICTLLGHPPRCPHDKVIPPGECCTVFTRKVTPLVHSLKDLEVGKRGRVLFINVPVMDRLASLGLVPGATLRLNQRRPTFVIEVDETTLAIEEDIAKGIYVKQVS